MVGDGNGLENRRAVKSLVGSIPSLSAKLIEDNIMDISEIERLYDSYLIQEGINGLFDITDELCATIYFKYVYPYYDLQYVKDKKSRMIRIISTQLNYTRLSLLRVKYMRNNYSAKGIKEGFVYLITNPAWPNHMKIGSAIDVKRRFNSYQTYSPMRDYELKCYYFTNDRFSEEKQYHIMMPNNNEWCEGDIDAISSLFASKRLHSKSTFAKYIKI